VDALLDRVAKFLQDAVLQGGHFLPFGTGSVIKSIQVKQSMNEQHLKLRHYLQAAEFRLALRGLM